MKQILKKTIKKDKQVIKIAQKKNRTNKDVWFLLLHDPILKIAMLCPIIILIFEMILKDITPFDLILWLIIYPITLFNLLKYLPVKDQKMFAKYEEVMPKKADYKSKKEYYKAYLKFIWLGTQGKYK